MGNRLLRRAVSVAISGTLLGLGVGVSAAEDMAGLDVYSVVVEADGWTKEKSPVYGSIYKVYYNKSSNWGTVRYIRDGKNETLFNFDNEGDIYVVNKEHSIRYKVHEPVLKDFARMAEKLRTGDKVGHRLDEEEVRRITNKVNNLSNTIINPEVLKQSDFIASGPRPEGDSLVQASAAGELALAVGEGAAAEEKNSTAVGSWASAHGRQSTALGSGGQAYADGSTALGSYSHVDGSSVYGVALGDSSVVGENAPEGTALGSRAEVSHRNSVALGARAHTTRDNEVYIGYVEEAGKAYKTRVLGGLSDGTRPSDAATVRQVDRVKDSVEQLAQDTNTRLVVEAKKSREYTDSRTTVGVNSDGTLTRAEGASKTLAVNDGLVALSGRTDRIDAAVGSVDRRVTKNTQAIQSNTRQLQEHNARLNSQQRQIRENHEEMKRAAAQSAALAGLFQPYSVGKFNATAALGGYSDKQAIAVGVGYRFNEQTAAKAGIAASDGDVSYNMGVNFEF
ncbi:hypothetical protein A8X13_005132 [Escherichia coli]|nr:hypothetical protein [Escherichia coli]